MVQNGSKWSNIFEMVYYGLILSKTVQNGPKKYSISKKIPKWYNKVQIHLKLFQKMTAVGVTAVGVYHHSLMILVSKKLRCHSGKHFYPNDLEGIIFFIVDIL